MFGLPLNKGDISEIHVAHRLALIHCSCRSNRQSEL